jgi:hypothetical protein
MLMSNWAFAGTFTAAVVGSMIVLAIVWVRHPREER